ncbi:mRNA-decapping enzyme 1B [Sesbania bispinosa]|nr:mRNA-decapping enzyme 1B [Sesbania bispinosa]
MRDRCGLVRRSEGGRKRVLEKPRFDEFRVARIEVLLIVWIGKDFRLGIRKDFRLGTGRFVSYLSMGMLKLIVFVCCLC